MLRALVETNKGTIRIDLLAEQAPVTVANFVNLSQKGFYDGLSFHRVIDDFMIQGGDPTGTGMGGPGYQFEDECKPGLKHDKPGIFSMANAGPGTNGSQFFVTHTPTPHLDGKHTVFGEVNDSQQVVDSIQQGDQIIGIEIHDSTDALFADQADRISEWNAKLG